MINRVLATLDDFENVHATVYADVNQNKRVDYIDVDLIQQHVLDLATLPQRFKIYNRRTVSKTGRTTYSGTASNTIHDHSLTPIFMIGALGDTDIGTPCGCMNNLRSSGAVENHTDYVRFDFERPYESQNTAFTNLGLILELDPSVTNYETLSLNYSGDAYEQIQVDGNKVTISISTKNEEGLHFNRENFIEGISNNQVKILGGFIIDPWNDMAYDLKNPKTEILNCTVNNNALVVDYTFEENDVLTVYDISGKVVAQEVLQYVKDRHEVSLNELSFGIYIASIRTNDDVVSTKFVYNN